MKEITDIIAAFNDAQKSGLKTALATVVSVEGSSYRRPGARMLITEDGMLTGAISGGCLEGDALKKALSAIHQQENKLVTYDTTDEDDAKFGVQLGCNGIVHILFEPIDPAVQLNPIHLLTALKNQREDAVIITLFSLTEKMQLGTMLFYTKNSQLNNLPTMLKQLGEQDAATVLKTRSSKFTTYDNFNAFVEFIQPPISLIIAGAGNDVQPLAQFAYQLGWNVIIADGRPTHATVQRFPTATKVLVAKPQQLMEQITIDNNTAFALMTHNYNYDTELLAMLLKTDAPYIGTLGPKKKLLRMLDELESDTEENRSRIHGPIGLDIGAETAEEIAISIIAEIKSVFTGASAGLLKEKTGSVHSHSNHHNL